MPLEVFYSYAHEDEKLRDEIEKNLSLLRRQGLIVGWSDRRIGAGDSWKAEIDAHVHSAQIILLLISADFLASDYCWGEEMTAALERHKRHEAIVIPIILRPVDWAAAPFAKLQALPRDGKPVSTWPNRDEAFADIARGIREIVQRFQPPASGAAAGPGVPASGLQQKDEYVPKPRVLDAALPSRIVKHQATQLLVLIRLPESKGLIGTVLAEEDSEAKPQDVRSKEFGVTFPLGLDGRPQPLKVTVQLTSPGFDPPGEKKNIFVPPDRDSEVCRFLLTPVRTGKLTVLVELQWEDVLQGSRSLKTECIAYVPRNIPTFDSERPGESAIKSSPAGAEMNVVHLEVNASVGRPAPPQLGYGVSVGNATVGSTTKPSFPPAPTPPRPQDPGDTGATRAYKSPGDGGNGETAKEKYEIALRVNDSDDEPAGCATTVSLPKSSMPKIVLAVIAAISTITVGYWQYGAWTKGSPHTVSQQEVVLRWHVMNARTKEFVPDARVNVVLDSGSAPVEKFTDSSGNVSVNLTDVKPDTHGKIYVHAEGYQPLDKEFVVSGSTANQEFRLEPIKNAPPPPPPRSSSNLIAGRVIDSSTNAGVSHASISLAGRTETDLTDDNGNFRIRLSSPVSNQGVRMQVKKRGCATRDQVVRPTPEGLTLELNCSQVAVR